VFLLSRRQTRAAISAAAGAAVYLAASGLGKDRMKMTGLFVLASASMAGMVTAQSSSKAKNTEARLNHLLTNGGTFGGNVTVNGNHTVTGTLHGSGGTLTVGDAIDTQNNNIQNINSLSGNGATNLHSNSTLGMNTNDIASVGHLTATQIGPGSDRTGIGSGATLVQCANRCDYLLTQLEGAGICY
jgi:hypothetical protein